MTQLLQTVLEKAGMSQSGAIDPRDIRFSSEIRALCQANTCRQYAATWVCPPAVGSVEACARRIRAYDHMLVFNRVYSLADSFDLEGMMRSLRQFKKSCHAINAWLTAHMEDYLLLSNEGCGLCKACTYPHAPCRFPGQALHALEGYGLDVSELAALAGIRYHNGPNTVTYFGALAYHAAESAPASHGLGLRKNRSC